MTMYLTDLRIDAFGSVRDISLERLGRGLTGVYGANGSGKTSVLQFLRGAFGDCSASFWNHSHTTPTGSFDVHAKDGRRKVTVQSARIAPQLDSPEMAQLATVTAAEAHNTGLVQQLAAQLGVELTYHAADFSAERSSLEKLLREKDELTVEDGPISLAETALSNSDESIAAAHGEQARTADRLSAQARALQSAISSTRREVDAAHERYQATQTDLTEWQVDAWRPRRITRVLKEVSEPQQSESRPDESVTVAGTDLRTALLEIARLRCQASARRAEATAGGPLDLCSQRLVKPMQIADEIRESLGRLRNAAGTVPAAGLAARVDDLIASMTDQQRAVDWLEADRTRVLLDRCERDLEQAALRSCSVCATGSTACDADRCHTASEHTATQTVDQIEPAANHDQGRHLADRQRTAFRHWQTSLARHRQAKRHLEQFEREVDRLAGDDRLAHLLAARESTLQRLAELHGRVAVLNDSIAALRQILAEDRAPSGTLVDAGRYFQRLTCDHYSGLHTTAKHPQDLRATTAQGESLALQELSRGTRAQAALAMRLAVLDELAKADCCPPLILDDVLVESDRNRANAAINVLADWSTHRQTIFMTCQQQLIEALANAKIEIKTLSGDSVAPQSRRETITEATSHGEATSSRSASSKKMSGSSARVTKITASGRETPRATAHLLAITPVRETRSSNSDFKQITAKPITRKADEQATKPTFWLDPDSMIVRTPSLSDRDARRLESIGIESIEHLLLVDASDIEADLVVLQINPRDFVRWQSEARLLTLVPGLNSRDAQLLAWAGISDASQLATINIDELRSRLMRLSQNRSTKYLRIETESFSQNRLNGWRSRAGRARSARSLFHNRPKLRSVRDAKRDRSRQSERNDRSRSSNRGQARTLSVVERRRTIRRSSTENGQKSERTTPKQRRIDSAQSKVAAATTTTEWRYYLETSSPVVDAPSIGPKMAKRLAKLRVKTVADLLGADAGIIANGLNDRRIKQQTVVDWQDQARLICRIPMLRGHDAQVLVACDFRDTNDVASASPKAMFSIVEPFVSSKEGERLLRSAKVPDLDEVTDWINWARNARTLQAA